MNTSLAREIADAIREAGNPEGVAAKARFYKAFPGGYGEGDSFFCTRVPVTRSIALRYEKSADLKILGELLRHEVHEVRLCALFMMIRCYGKSDAVGKKAVVDLYLDNLDRVNNWDLVDSSAHKLLGDYLLNRDRGVLYKLAGSGDLWRERVSLVACFAFIRSNDFADIIRLSRQFLSHEHDLIHKAAGWMLREAGKRDESVLLRFLNTHAHEMPRTMLRYSIEKLSSEKRKMYMGQRKKSL